MPITPREAFERSIPDILVEEKGNVIEVAYEVARELIKASGPGYAATKKTLFQEEVNQKMTNFEKEILDWQLTVGME